MADVAKEAGVALQSVYTAGRSKADLLHLVTDVAVAGDDEDVMLIERPEFAALAGEPDATRQVQLIASLITATLERPPIWTAYREAAAVDPKAAGYLEAAHRRRQTFGQIIRMIPESALRQPYERSADTMWAIGSIDVFLLLR